MTSYVNSKSKVLFFHNTIPEYRIEFWNYLNELCELTVAFFNLGLASDIYGLDIGENKFKTVNVHKNFKKIKALISHSDYVILPPVDDIECIAVTFFIKYYCKILNVPYFFWTEKWEAPLNLTPFKKKVKNFIQRLIIKACSYGAKKYIVSGTKAKDYLLKIGIKRNLIDVVLNSSSSPSNVLLDIRKKHSIPCEKKIILYFGRIIERKGLDYLIKACLNNFEKWNCVLLVCGTGDFEITCKELSKHNCSIIFAGLIQPQFRRAYYEQCDVFVLPSIVLNGVVEGWGLSVNEALECRTPVVVTTAVGAAYDVVTNENGRVVPDKDIYALTESIDEILNGCTKDVVKQSYKNIFSVRDMADCFFQKIISK